MPTPCPAPLLLASTSTYRARLLERLGIAFDAVDPAVDESLEQPLAPKALARALAVRKARAGAEQRTGCVVLGSDQVAACDGRVLSKPGSAHAQAEQLRFLSGKTATFHTAIAVVDAGPGRRRTRQRLVTTRVRLRHLDCRSVERYVEAEPATDCCGGFKCEGLGIALFERIEAPDPTALEGLPLIATAQLLRATGFAIP